jgi:hypothetical protein
MDVVDEIPDQQTRAIIEMDADLTSAMQFVSEDFKEIVNAISLIVAPSTNDSMNRYHGGLSLSLRKEVMRQVNSSFATSVFKVSYLKIYFLQILICHFSLYKTPIQTTGMR